MDYDLTISLCIIGDFGTGKTALLRKLKNPELGLDDMPLVATLGVDFISTFVTIGNRRIKLCIWDTAGQEAFRSITRTFYRNIAGFIYVFSMNDQKTLDRLDGWDRDICTTCNSPFFKKIIIGTKSDLPQKINDLDCYNKARSLGGDFIKTSITENVEHIFYKLVNDILATIKNNDYSLYISNDYGIKPRNYMEISKNVDIDEDNINNNKNCCTIL